MAVQLEDKPKVKIAAKLTLPKSFIAEAIIARNTPLYANETRFKGFSYEDDIFPQARLAFGQYNKLYDTNEELTKYFARDFSRKSPELIQQIGSETATEEVAATEQPTQTAISEPTGGGDGSGGMQTGTPGLGTPSAPSSFGPMIHNIPHTPKEEIPETPKLVTPNKGIAEAGKPSELVITDKSGNIVKGPGAQTPPSKIFISDSSGNVIREQSIRTPSRFSSFRTKFGRGISNTARSGLETANPFLKRFGNNLLGGLEKVAGFGGTGGTGTGSRSIFNRFRGFKGKGVGQGTSTLGKTAGKGKLIFIGSILLLLVLTGTITMMNSNNTSVSTGTPSSGSPPTSPGSLQGCTFTRAGESVPIKSSILAGWLSNTANTAGVPPAVLASIARHESPDVIKTYDDSNQAITTNEYCATGAPVCIQGGNKIHDGECTPDELQANSTVTEESKKFKTAKARGLMQLIDVYNPDMTEADLCNIQKNIQRGAETLKGKVGSGTFNNDDDIKKAVCRYFGVDDSTCPYPGGDYGPEALTDYKNCQALSRGGLPPGVATDCPIPNGTISCGSQTTPINGCGHCGIGYPAESTRLYCGYSGTKYAIDVEGNDFQPILLPKIGGNIVNWTYKGEEAGATEAVQKYAGIVSSGSSAQTYYLQLHHTQPGSGNQSAKQSGDVGGKICGGGCNERHTHVQIGSGGDSQNNTGWLDAAQYFCK